MIEIDETTLDANETFGTGDSWRIPAFREPSEHVPATDPNFCFLEAPTRAILLGFAHNRRVYLHGPHGSGKSSHIEQVAARLNWPCIRLNLDGHITRSDLIGRDMVVLRKGQQVTEFVPGILPWALERPVALVLDEYDAARPDVMFVIQRLLEDEGKLTLLDQNRVIQPHPAFRIFATANTAGQGDVSGLYAGTQVLNQAQMDRWQVFVEFDYPPEEQEAQIVCNRVNTLAMSVSRDMVCFANLCREAHRHGDLSVLVSLRTLIIWAETMDLDISTAEALQLSLLNRCDPSERDLVAELYQRAFGEELELRQADRAIF